MKLRRVTVAIAACVGLAGLAGAPSGLAAPLPTAWQPVVSDDTGAIGYSDTITQPTNVTGVVALLPPTGIPAPTSGTLVWDATAHTLSWRGGPAVAVNPAVTSSYTLPEPSTGASLIVDVTANALPAANASDTLNVTKAKATAGFGDVERDTARGSVAFNNDIYLGIENGDTDLGEVWRSADGVNWVKAAPDSFGQGSVIEHPDAFTVFGGQLYVGTDSGQIWRTSNGSLWTQATPTPGFDQNVTAFATFNHLLYANQSASGHPGGVFRSSDGASWSNLFTFGEPQLEYTHDLQVFNGSLFSSVGSYKGYLGPGAGEIASSSNGTSWQLAAADGFGSAANTDISGLAVFGTALYAATFNATQGAEVWRTTDGKTWSLVNTPGFGDANNKVIHKLIVFGNELYAGTENDVAGGEIYRTSDGTTWSLANVPGFGTGKYQRIRSFFKFGGYLYANGQNDCTGGLSGCTERGWELWRLK